MTARLQESLAEMLLGFHDLEDLEQIKSLVESANKGSASGANHFVENAGQAVQPHDLKNFLRMYPMAQAMVAMVRHYELNKETDTLKVVLESLLEGLEEREANETLH
ncbi:hypothetical protein [Endozoicomonas arenosclerae]|uniref:hypothetical protein n=1 Tax=Endozoicomonas arenosclerae TaxID=1633495 RepID=UPI000B167CAA|nr:hypothetical protein [Endozoicomonas arenosclerae]